MPQILSSRKTRIKTFAGIRSMCRVPAPQILSSRKTRIKTHLYLILKGLLLFSQILSSRKTRIKTLSRFLDSFTRKPLRYYPPEKQGLRRSVLRELYEVSDLSDTILQKNKD